jgi:hypothetical protein
MCEYDKIIIGLKKTPEMNATNIDITEFYYEFVFDNDYQDDRKRSSLITMNKLNKKKNNSHH